MLNFYSSMLCTSKIHSFSPGNYLGTSLINGNSMRIRATSVQWTRLGLEWPHAQYVALGTNSAQDFDLIVDLHLVDVDDVARLVVTLSDVERHASLLPSFLLQKFLYFGVNEITSFQKLVQNLDKTTIANLGRQHRRSLDSYFKIS